MAMRRETCILNPMELKMLSIEETRKLIEGNEEYTDEEITQIRNTCQGMVELILDHYFEEHRKKQLHKDQI